MRWSLPSTFLDLARASAQVIFACTRAESFQMKKTTHDYEIFSRTNGSRHDALQVLGDI
jgi:hypothetical protein